MKETIETHSSRNHSFATQLSALARACAGVTTSSGALTLDDLMLVHSSGVTTQHRQGDSDKQSFSLEISGKMARQGTRLFTEALECIGISSAVVEVNNTRQVTVSLPESRIETVLPMLRSATEEIGGLRGNFMQAAEAVSIINRMEGMLGELSVQQLIVEGATVPRFMPRVTVTTTPKNTNTVAALTTIARAQGEALTTVDGWRDSRMHARENGVSAVVSNPEDIAAIRSAVEKDTVARGETRGGVVRILERSV